MLLEFSRQELRVLRHAIKIYLDETKDEAAHTDALEYRNELRNEVQRLEEIDQKLAQAMVEEEAA